ADRAALLAARYHRPLELAFLPIALPLAWIGARIAATKDGEAPPADPRVTQAEVELLVEEGEKSGLFRSGPAGMVKDVLEFADRTARDVMIARDKVEAISMSTSLEDARRMVTESGHSRYPIYNGRLDDVVGLLYAKDLFKAVGGPDAAKRTVADFVRPANFV